MPSGHLSVGHPVDVATGLVSTTAVDVSINGRMALSWEREFITPSSPQTAGPVGVGWSTRYHATLRRAGGAFELALGPQGTVAFPDPDGVVERGGGVRDLPTSLELTRWRDEYVVTSWDSETYDVTRYRFGGAGVRDSWRLTSIENASGAALTLYYDAAGRLQAIQQAREQRALRLEYSSAGQVRQIHLMLAGGRSQPVAWYEHDARGRLLAAFDVMGRAAHYAYDADSRLVRETSRCGEEYYFRYDADGRCVETTGPDGYDLKALRFFPHRHLTEVTDSRGNVWQYHANPLGQVVAAVSPRGAVTATRYDEHGRIVASIDPLGRTTAYAYDDAGNRASTSYPNGAETRARFDAYHRLASITDPLGASWHYAYDDVTGRLREVAFPTGLRVVRAYDAAGDLRAMENSAGGVWRYDYDQYGQLVTLTDGTGVSCRRAYNDRGDVVELVDAAGGVTRYEYDAAGTVTGVRHPDGTTRRVVCGARGEVVQVIESDARVTTYEYGPGCTQVRRVQAPGGLSTEYVWGKEPNQLLALVHAGGGRHTFTYDADGYLIGEVYPGGRTVSYVRDLCGFVTERINGAGERTAYRRDAVGRVVDVAYHDGTDAHVTYDAAGLVVKAEYAGTAVEIERNLAGDRVRESSDGFSVASDYDVLGNRTARRSSFGASTRYEYDTRGQIVRLELSATAVVERQLDRLGRETARRFGALEMLSRYDEVGRLVERSVRGRKAPSRLTALSYQRSHREMRRHFSYDTLGNLTEVSDTAWGRTNYQYDDAGHVTDVRVRDVTTEQYAYDADENVVLVRFPDQASGRAPVTSARHVAPGDRVVHDGTTRYEYDGDGRLVRTVEAADSGPPRVWQFGWNSLGLLASATSPAGEQWRYSYDGFGRRTRKVGPGTDVAYHWDGNAVLHEVRGGDVASATTWTFWPADFEPVAKQQHGAVYFAVTDHLGTPREYVTDDGTLVWSARYTLFGSVAELAAAGGEFDVRFQGQWFEPETGLHQNGLRHYSPWLAAFTSMDPVPLAGGPNAYLYAPNPLRFIDPHGLAVTPWPLDDRDRPTGASGTLTRRDLRPTDSSPPTLDPPGWVGGGHPDHQQRSHVVGDTLGGSGSDPRNIVALTDGSNHPGMSTAEGKVRRFIQQNGGPVHYEVHVNYQDNHLTPSSVHITAIDKHGNVIVDEHVTNGRRQKTKCCP